MADEADELRAELLRYKTWMPPGHFYSPIPDQASIAKRKQQIFEPEFADFPGIEMHAEAQFAYAQQLLAHYRDDYFPRHATGERRYYWDNEYFPFGDAFFTDRFLRDSRPQRVIEVGSGFSSALMLDVCTEWRAAGQDFPKLDFIEPYPDRLKTLLRAGDSEFCTLHEMEVQDVSLSLFEQLRARDLLFIDSSHVIKTGSDLWYLFFHVLPRLARGVFIFLHDITWPLEYPRAWVEEGRAWNEIYLLRAFLQYNEHFVVRWFPGLALSREVEIARQKAPMLFAHCGSGIWIERVR